MRAQRLVAALSRPGPLLLVIALLSFYRFMAWTWADGLSLFSDEAQYWHWSQSLDWGYYSKPPVIAALIRLATTLAGTDEAWALKLVPLALYPATGMLIFALGRSLYRPAVGRDAALLFLLMPAMWLSAVIVSTDVPLLFFWSAALLCLWRALQSDSWHDWVLTGTVVGLGLLSKYSMAFFVIALLLFALCTPGERRLLINPRLYAAGLLALLVFLPNLLWNLGHDFITFRHHLQLAGVDGEKMDPERFVHFVTGQFLVFGPVSFTLLLGVLLSRRYWRRASRPTRFLLAFCVVPLLLVLALAPFSRAYANWGAPLYIAGAVLLAFALRRRRRWLYAALALNVGLGICFYHLPAALSALGLPLKTAYDPHQRLRGWDEVGYGVQRLLQEYPDTQLLGSERNLMALLMYYARPLGEPRIWAPPGPPASHYHLTLPLRDDERGSYLWVRSSAPTAAERARFDRVEFLEEVVVRPYPGLERRCQVWKVDGFRGYGRPGG